MNAGSTLIDRCVVGVDVEGYSRRDLRRQRDAQRDLRDLLAEAARRAGLDRTAWEVFHTGDGELAVLPADVNLLAVVGRFIPELHGLLVLRNEDRVPGTKIRLRLAMHIDTLTPSTPGHYAGAALVVLTRLLDSRPVRDALGRAAHADLAVILSTPVYDKVVLSGLLAVCEGDFAPVEVHLPAKGFHQVAYVHVPGHDMRTFGAGATLGPPAAPVPAPSPVGAPGPGSIVVGGNLVTGGDFVHGDVDRAP